ncbi:MAG: DUF2079 domain-containing protein, partial [Candidatus Cybelea sp.]
AVHGRTAWQPVRFYAWSASDARALAAGIVERLGFLLLIFVPLLFLPFLTRMMWLAVAPLAEVLLSRMPTTYVVGTHYAGAWIGYVLIAFAFGVRELRPGRQRAALFACTALCIVELLVADPLHPGLNLRRPDARDAALDRFLKTLPPDAAVATQEEAYTHQALGDPYARLLPETPDRAILVCFVLVDSDFSSSARLQEYGSRLDRLVRERRYVPVARSGRIVLYRSTERSCASASSARAGQSSSARTI